MSTSEAEQVELCLSLIAYAGASGESARRSSALHGELAHNLRAHELTRAHELVWGPASFRVWWQSSAPALMVFVTAKPDQPGCHVVVRGGAPMAVWDHQLESFGCLEQEPWRWAREAGNLAPAVCAGIRRQLDSIRELAPEDPLPGAGRSLAEFLAERVRAGGDRRVPIHVVGHGIGGALAAAVALWLHDTQGHVPARDPDWDPGHRAKLYCTAFASPTIGNGDFAGYIHARLGSQLELIHNSLDHALALWDTQQLAELPDLYSPHVPEPPGLVRAVIEALCDELERQGVEYEQPPTRVLDGRLNTRLPPTFAAQAEYQHLHAYVDLLGLGSALDLDAILDRPAGTDDVPVAQ